MTSYKVLDVNDDLPIRTKGKVHSGKVRSVYWLTDADSKRLINEKGYRLKDVAKKLDTSPKLITNIIKSKGRRYNAKKIKVERIKNHE